MEMIKGLFTSEQVGAGHPDKLADQVSDAVLDACLKQDKNSRVGCETLISNRLVVVGGEITTKAKFNVKEIVREVLERFNYDAELFTIIDNINTQSPDINQGVDKKGGEIGAGDQGIMFGFATNETKKYMPLAWLLSSEILKTIEKTLMASKWYDKNFDMKSQVTINYDGKTPVVDTVLVSCQVAYKDQAKLKKLVKGIVDTVLSKDKVITKGYRFLFNPTGKFEIGGPIGDAGLTGRKIIADTYGGYGRHGGGAFSGKDCTKVDRSAAYMARYMAKNIVAAGWANTAEVQLSYAIGVAEPTSIQVKLNNSEFATKEQIEKIRKVFPMTPAGIIKHFDLTKPIFQKTTTYGHFGKNNLPWEQLDMVSKLK